MVGDRDEDKDLQLLLIGKTGSGKSATGNLIFNETVFESVKSSSSVTRVCKSHTGSVHNRNVKLTDTPDFRFSTHTDFDSDSELKRALELCSAGAHVILLVLPLSTFTEQEMEFIDWFEQKFGADALRFTLVLFTHADQRHMRSLGEMIRANPRLFAFISRCAQRYHEFNIKAPANRQQVTELMEKILRLVSENRNFHYTLEMMEETERRREKKNRAEEEERRRDHQMILDRVRRETEIEVREEYEWEKVETSECESEAERSSLPETFLNYQCKMYMAFGAAGGAIVGGAVVGGAVVGVAVGAVIGAVGGVIADRAKGGPSSVAESPSSLNKTEEAQSF